MTSVRERLAVTPTEVRAVAVGDEVRFALSAPDFRMATVPGDPAAAPLLRRTGSLVSGPSLGSGMVMEDGAGYILLEDGSFILLE